MPQYLLIGPILFQDFELPPSISWGGAQALHIHKLPGGTRIIDAMGRDDAPITWTGVFTGADAGLRARAIDLMRADGNTWPLTWDTYFYSIIIERFEADFRRPNWIPYRISCAVLRDEVERLATKILSLAASVGADLKAADTAGSGLDLSATTAAITALGATTRGTSSYTQAQSQLGISATQADASLATAGQQLVAAKDVTTATSLAGNAAGLAAARAYLQRASVNLSHASS
jgi:hypothetical protein